MNYLRSIILFLSLLQTLMSFLFYRFAGLFFYLEEISEVYPVSQLASQGGDEDSLISIGCILFIILSIFNLARLRSQIGRVDIGIMLLVLSVQALSLMLIEVGSFRISMEMDNGWILLGWFVVYGTLWLSFMVSVIDRYSRVHFSLKKKNAHG